MCPAKSARAMITKFGSRQDRRSFQEFLGRIDRANSQGSIAPMEFVAVAPDGNAVFAQPFVKGRGVSDATPLPRLNGSILGFSPSLAARRHPAKSMASGSFSMICIPATCRPRQVGEWKSSMPSTRELTPEEVDHLRELGKLPDDIPDSPEAGPITAPMVLPPEPSASERRAAERYAIKNG
jgi:hypothetical protein